MLIRGGELKQYIQSMRECTVRASAFVIGSRHGSVVFDFTGVNVCTFTLRKHSGNGKVVVTCGDKVSTETVTSKSAQKLTVDLAHSKSVKLSRPKDGIGSVIILDIALDMDWNTKLSKASECRSIKIVNGKALASEGSNIKADAIREVATNPPNMFKINNNNTVVEFAGACEITSLQLDGQGGAKLDYPHLPEVTQSSPGPSKGNGLVRPAPASPRVILDTRSNGFHSQFANGDAKVPNRNFARLGRHGAYSIPLSLLQGNTEYSVLVEASPVSRSGNSKFTVDIEPSTSPAPTIMFAANKTKAIMINTAPMGPYKLVIGRHPSSTGDILLNRIVLSEAHARKLMPGEAPAQQFTLPELPAQMVEYFDGEESSADGSWRLGRIPKTIHFYWGAKKLPFLRYLCLYSFIKQNCDWKVKLHVPATLGPNQPTWHTVEQKETTKTHQLSRDYMAQARSLPIEIVTHDFKKYSFNNNAHEVHKSDFLRWILLSSEGGVWSDNDIIFTQPMSFMTDNTTKNAGCDTVVCQYPHGAHAIGFLMSSQKNAFYTAVSHLARKNFRSNRYQSLGSDILNTKFPKLMRSSKNCKLLRLNPNTVYSVTNIPDFLSPKTYIQNYPDAIGFHWYGGHPRISKVEATINSDNYTDHKSFIAKLVQYVME